MPPRGIRNNNPGNIRHGEKWLGLADEQPDRDFCTFKSAVLGIRAMARILHNYQRLHGLATVAGMIARWAPPSENDTDAYVRHVAGEMGVEPDQAVDLAADIPAFRRMVAGMIHHENGIQPYSDGTITTGINLALED